MKIGSRYTLERPTTGEVLGTLTVTDTEMFAIRGTFEATPTFDPYRPLFDEEDRLTTLIADDASDDLIDEVEQIFERIQSLQLQLRREGNLGFREVLLGISGTQAHFRPLTEEESL